MTAAHSDSFPIHVVVVARSLAIGGAAKAAGRLIEALEAEERGSPRTVSVVRGDLSIDPDKPEGRRTSRWPCTFANWLVKALRIPLRLISGFGHRAPSDYGIVKSGLGRRIPLSPSCLIHLHWIGDGDLSVREIAKLSGPVVWTMHDMWTFLGAERFTLTDSYLDGYRTNHGEPLGRQFINRVFFTFKKKLWTQPITLVAPSSWMAQRAKLSPITQNWPVHVIPNALDTDFWTPGSSEQSRVAFGLPEEKWVILFGAVDPLGDHNKGADLLESALAHFRTGLSADEVDSIHIAVFGSAKRKVKVADFPVSLLGELSGDGMRDAYRSANVVIVPSRLENLPQVATEATACGVPVVAFNTCGLPDVVAHEATGLLVEPFNTEEMATAIATLFRDSKLASLMGEAGRKRAQHLWSYSVVAKQHLALYSSLIER